MKKYQFAIVGLIALTSILVTSCTRCQYTPESKQQAMVEQQIRFRGIADENVLRVMRDVPREEFVLPEYRDRAYEDLEVPIGEGQTLDRPYEDALIIDTLKLTPTDTVLEVGSGTGYLASLMSRLAGKVYTIEILEPLGKKAQENIKRLGYTNVEVKIGDGFVGWPEHAPFDVIMLTASPSEIPLPLKEQLAEGGRILAPMGGEKKFQELLLYVKKNGELVLDRRVAPVEFVPMRGEVEEQKTVR